MQTEMIQPCRRNANVTVKQIQVQSDNATVSSNAYQYDAAGNRLQETVLSGTQTNGTFNNLNQLTNLSSLSPTVFSGSVNKPGTFTVNGNAVTLDGSNNFSTSLLLPSGLNTVTLVAQDNANNKRTNHYSYNVSAVVNVNPTYDYDGNMLTDENGNAFTWDAKNELVKIVNGSNTYAFAYDGLGHRISETDNNTLVKQWVWVGTQMAEERDGSNNVKKRFFAQGFQIKNGSTVTNYYYTRDHLGSVRELCSSTGTITSRMAYDPYGVTTTVSGTVLPTKQYAGMYWHAPSQSYQTQRRIYRPNVGLWPSRDPLGEKNVVNLYGYCGNNPIFAIDPLGLCACPCASGQWTGTGTAKQIGSGYVVLGGIPHSTTVDRLRINWCGKLGLREQTFFVE